jgi:hypothetical protein
VFYRGSTTRNTVRPGRLSTPTVPLCAATTALTMARPRPLPPEARERALSARTKRSKISDLDQLQPVHRQVDPLQRESCDEDVSVGALHGH